jgi:hypothetical protein
MGNEDGLVLYDKGIKMDELEKMSSAKARTSAVDNEIQDAICRVEEMESRFEQLAQVVSELSAALDKYADAGESLKVLDAYYGSDEWQSDFATDEKGLFPKDLKRGVLSEDAVWNLLSDYRDLKERMQEMVGDNVKD